MQRIAEAAMSITDVFATAQKTAEVYLEEIACLKKEAEEILAKAKQKSSEDSVNG